MERNEDRGWKKGNGRDLFPGGRSKKAVSLGWEKRTERAPSSALKKLGRPEKRTYSREEA